MIVPRSLSVFAGVLASFCFVSLASAQLVEKPGVALVKPQAWSQPSQATAMEFRSYTDRSVKTTPGAGYFEFRTERGQTTQIPAGRVVKMVIYPEVPVELVTAEQRQALQKAIDDFNEIARTFPSAARALDPSIKMLSAEAAKFDAGNVKIEGNWQPRTAYFRQKAAKLVELANADIASSGGDFNLEVNQYYLGLLDLVKAEPSVKPQADAVKATFDMRSRKASRDALLSQLAAPSLTKAQAEPLVAKLRALSPAEDPASAAYLRNWDNAVAAAGDVTRVIEEARTAFETDFKDGSTTVDAEAVQKVREASALLARFRAGSPPAAIKVPSDAADAMSAYIEEFPAVQKKMAEKMFFDAKEILDPIGVRIAAVGPNAAAAVRTVQRQIGEQIEKFSRLRDEAKLLADTQKNAEALKKYEEAYAVIPAPDVAAQMEALKKAQ